MYTGKITRKRTKLPRKGSGWKWALGWWQSLMKALFRLIITGLSLMSFEWASQLITFEMTVSFLWILYDCFFIFAGCLYPWYVFSWNFLFYVRSLCTVSINRCFFLSGHILGFFCSLCRMDVGSDLLTDATVFVLLVVYGIGGSILLWLCLTALVMTVSCLWLLFCGQIINMVFLDLCI